MLKKTYKKYRHFIHYALIGITGVILDFGSFFVLYNVIGVNPVVATCVSVIVGITNNFILNALFNFKKKDQLLIRYLSFLSVGLSGLLISMFVLAFGQVFALDANLMKLVSLPIIVFYQYFLNKSISFKDIDPHTTLKSIFKSVTSKHWGLMVINVIFIISALFFVKMVPFENPTHKYDGAPDESVHYSYNVGFMLQNHRLPISGKDDVPILKSCDVRDYGIVPCTYSYEVFPAANYVFSAVISTIVTSLTPLSPVTGSRIASVIWGIVFLNFLYLLAKRVTGNRRASWAIASIGLIPQVIFTFSYTNQDAHSMAISAICFYALIRLLQDKSTLSIVIASFAFGALLPIAKFNFFLLIPFIALILIALAFAKQLSFKLLGKLFVGSLLAFIVFSLFWYVRNYLLYHDVFGQDFVLMQMAKYAPLGHVAPFGLPIIETYTQLNFFETSYRSFFLTFGAMAHYATDGQYAVLQALLLILLAGYAYIIYTAKNARMRVHLSVLLALFLAILAGVVALSFYNSLKLNFQPQGRYFYPLLAPLAACLSVAYIKDRRIKYILVGIVFVVFYCSFIAIDVVMRNYLAF